MQGGQEIPKKNSKPKQRVQITYNQDSSLNMKAKFYQFCLKRTLNGLSNNFYKIFAVLMFISALFAFDEIILKESSTQTFKTATKEIVKCQVNTDKANLLEYRVGSNQERNYEKPTEKRNLNGPLKKNQNQIQIQATEEQSKDSPNHQNYQNRKNKKKENNDWEYLMTDSPLISQMRATFESCKFEIKQKEVYAFRNNSMAINEIKTQQKKVYSNFEQKIKSLEAIKQVYVTKLQLFPVIQSWATSRKKMSNTQKMLELALGDLFPNSWRQLERFLHKGGYWESSGYKLTVGSQTQLKEDRYSSINLFIPTIITVEVPYDTSEKQTFEFYGLRLRQDLYTKEESNTYTQYLGELKIKVTEEEKNAKIPVRRAFYCQNFKCSNFYSMVMIITTNNLRIHSLKIESINTIEA